MIYQCGSCSKTSFEITCPWCASAPTQENTQRAPVQRQVPLDPSFYPEFQYQTKGFLKDLLGKKKEQAQLNDLLRSVLQKYSELKKPYFANFFHTMRHEGSGSSDASSPGPRLNGSYSNRELFREVLIRKGFTELEELPHLLDKLLFTTGFNAAYLGFSNEISRHVEGALRDVLRSWIGEAGTSFRDDLSLLFYFLWNNGIRHPELQYAEQAASTYGTPLLTWDTIQAWLRTCEQIHFDILVERLATKLEHFDPNRFVTMYHVDAMNGYDFEKFLAEIFQTAGYDVEGTKLSGDQGADLFVSRFGKKIVIQAKNYSGSVGNAAVQEAISAKSFYGCDEAMVVTNSYFTRSAIELASAAAVRLIGRRDLQSYLDDYNQRIIEQFRAEESNIGDTSAVDFSTNEHG
ncbi:restriction endonuclease [Paraburkholderia caribensis]|uniref:restriction endonuclease n=1 Tax=Paraburkholderia caribensis TaxID=75105 RepID=UPI001CB5BDE3|nr:restriction endonuclease [Paraburkholderia caribensis]CAG9242129.1 Restriction endonuclease [Paraburkholderia caribensis]